MAIEKVNTVREFASRLGIGMKRAYDLIWAGKGKAAKRNGEWAIPESEITARLKQRQTEK